jgi:hypothetical protein
LGSITNPGAGNDNLFKDIANGNGVSLHRLFPHACLLYFPERQW